MGTPAEGKVRVRFAVHHQTFAVGENAFITIGGRYPHDDAVARSNQGLTKGYVGAGRPHHVCRRRSPTQDLLDGCVQQLRVLAQPLPASRILGEGNQGTRYRERGRFQPAGEHAITIQQNLIVGEGSVLSMGVFISASTKIIDRATGKVHIGHVPPYSVVVPGSLPGKPLPDGSPGPSLYCAVIVKTVDAQTRAKTAINELLRA